MDAPEIEAVLGPVLKDISSRLTRLEHMLGNQANVLNLYVAQEESLKNNIAFMLIRAIATLEEGVIQIPAPAIERALNRLETLKSMLLERLEKVKAEG